MYVSSSSYNMHVSFSFTVSELGSKNKLGTKFANSVPSLQTRYQVCPIQVQAQFHWIAAQKCHVSDAQARPLSFFF
jgi:hypothetical protein